MNLLTLLLGELLLAQAERIVPMASTIATHGGLGPFGLSPVPPVPQEAPHKVDIGEHVEVPELLDAPAAPQRRPLSADDILKFSAPLDFRSLSLSDIFADSGAVFDIDAVDFGAEAQGEAQSDFADAQPLNDLESDRLRARARGSAPVQTWRVEPNSEPRVVKLITIKTQEDLFAAKNEIKAIMKTLDRGVFLTVQDLWKDSEDGTSEVQLAILMDDYEGSLRDMLDYYRGKFDVPTALGFFKDIADQLRMLRRKRIAHDSPSMADVLILGNPQDGLSSCRAVLCSSLANTNMRVCSARATLGRVLTFRGRKDPIAEMRSKADIEKADMQSLSQLFDVLVGALNEKDAATLKSLAESSAIPSTADNIERRVEHVRKEWLLLNPKEIEPRSTKSLRRWRPLARFYRPKTASDESFAAVMDDIAEAITDQVQMQAVNHQGFPSRKPPVKMQAASQEKYPFRDAPALEVVEETPPVLSDAAAVKTGADSGEKDAA